MQTIKVAEEFSATPGGRYVTDGPFNGETFREEFLLPAVKTNSVVTVVLDGARGYPSSFLDEAFAGLARKLRWTKKEFHRHIKLVASPQYQIYVSDIDHYIDVTQKQ